jgi:phosphatidylglycerophosphate synthase/putative flippase GtrA
MDVACSLGLIAAAVVLSVAYLVRMRLYGAAHHARVDAEGKSAILGRGPMEMFYWMLDPGADLCMRAGIRADTVTWTSLLFSLAGGVALGLGHFGLGAVCAAFGFAGDALDGLVARKSGEACQAGEVLDAAVDRYGEMATFGGLVVFFRSEVPILLLALFALAGAFMVSYSTSKAEALGVDPPRGSMRRPERALLLFLGAMLTPLVALLPGVERPWHSLPMIAALAAIAVFANVSAVARLQAVARATRAARALPQVTPLALAKHQASSLAATLVDYSTMISLVDLVHVDPVPATAIGAFFGAITNFMMGRRWIFRAHADHPGGQALRYALISGSSLGLNALGEWVLYHRVGIQYIAARMMVGFTVSVLWNFPMQRSFVFAPRTPLEPRSR